MCNMEQGTKTIPAVETWRPVKGFEGLYEVSDFGRVRSLDRTVTKRHQSGTLYEYIEKGIIMAQKLQNTDRFQVSLRKVVDGKSRRYTKYVHRLVAEAFVPNPKGLDTVNHKNENHHDNRADNLEWMTKAENNRYGTHCERVGKALRMSVEQLTEDGQHVAYFKSMSEAAEATGCSLSSIHACCYGKQQTTQGYRWRFTTAFRKLLRDRK